eukprot:m.209237 g.209237  ORF g.209237 m.209237 type:complete len:79 (+) comp18971_c0_seq1:1859-2095(+)
MHDMLCFVIGASTHRAPQAHGHCDNDTRGLQTTFRRFGTAAVPLGQAPTRRDNNAHTITGECAEYARKRPLLPPNTPI